MKLFRTKFSRIILWAFALNTVWEFGQCLFFYDMWSWPFWKSIVWKGASFLSGVGQFHKPSLTGYLVLLLLSFGASIVLEWMAIYLDLWSYDPFMPTIILFEREIGLLPILQITLLPTLSVYMASKK